MAFVAAICTQCGAQIEMDDTYETGICKHCGTTFVVDKAANELEQRIRMAEGLQQLGEYDNALEKYQKITEKYPQDVRGWLGCVQNYSEGAFIKEPGGWDAEWLDKEPFSVWYQKAYLLADDDIRMKLSRRKETYTDVVKSNWERFRSVLSFASFKQFIGNKVFGCGLSAITEKIYMSQDRLYIETYYYLNRSTSYVRLEITDMDLDGNLSVRVDKSFVDTSFFGDNAYARKQKRDWVRNAENSQLKVHVYDDGMLKMYINGYLTDFREVE